VISTSTLMTATQLLSTFKQGYVCFKTVVIAKRRAENVQQLFYIYKV